MGWRSQEQVYHLRKETGSGRGKWTDDSKPRAQYAPGEIPANLPERFFNQEGEVDLRQVTGNDAVKYLAAIGIKVPMCGGVSRG